MESQELVKCKKCKKMLKPESILKHIAKAKDCEAFYNDHIEELEMLRQNSKTRFELGKKSRSKEKRSTENSNYYKANKIRIAQKYQERNKNLVNFFKEIQYGPIFPCVCCHRCLFDRGMNVLSEKFVQFLKEFHLDTFIDLNVKKLFGNHYICDTCHRNLSKKAMPNLCFKNALKLSPVPKCLQISSLLNQLLAKSLIFYKFRHLPKTGMAKMNDRVTFSSKLSDIIDQLLKNLFYRLSMSQFLTMTFTKQFQPYLEQLKIVALLQLT